MTLGGTVGVGVPKSGLKGDSELENSTVGRVGAPDMFERVTSEAGNSVGDLIDLIGELEGIAPQFVGQAV